MTIFDHVITHDYWKPIIKLNRKIRKALACETCCISIVDVSKCCCKSYWNPEKNTYQNIYEPIYESVAINIKQSINLTRWLIEKKNACWISANAYVLILQMKRKFLKRSADDSAQRSSPQSWGPLGLEKVHCWIYFLVTSEYWIFTYYHQLKN